VPEGLNVAYAPIPRHVPLLRRLLARVFAVLRLLFQGSVRLASFGLPDAPTRVPKLEFGCDFAEDFTPPPAGTGALQLTSFDDTGIFQADSVTLPEKEEIRLVGPFVVLARGDIVIEGSVLRRAGLEENQDIVLISFEGTVRISGVVGGGSALDGSGTPASPLNLRSGAPGEQGSLTLLRGISIEIAGIVIGEDGGDGESVTTSSADRQGRSWAFGGAGGAGGDVLLCAIEGITMSEFARGYAGDGGEGGTGRATAGPSGNAVGVGGPGHDGGNIVFRGLPADATCQVVMEPGARVVAGNGGSASSGFAYRNRAIAPESDPGGEGRATGGDAGRGGEVRFENCTVVRVGRVESGNGGIGGGGTAFGGDGGSGPAGRRGGDAIARGGTGGDSGAEPAIPRPDGTVDRGLRGRPGRGRPVAAISGAGGRGTAGSGGESGSTSARGGASGAGRQEREFSFPPNPPRDGFGGAGRIVFSKGAN